MIYAKTLTAVLALSLSLACTDAGVPDEPYDQPAGEDFDAGPAPSGGDPARVLALSAPSAYTTTPTSWRGAVGRIRACPVLWLTETYAVTAAHCADSNGVTADDFTNNIATISGQTMQVRTTSGHYIQGGMSFKVRLHEGWDPYFNPGPDDPADASNDIAIYMVTAGNKWGMTTNDQKRARVYVSGTHGYACQAASSTKNKRGAATWHNGTSINERAESPAKYCGNMAAFPVPVDDLASGDPELCNSSSICNASTSLARGDHVDFEGNDSGGATYVTNDNNQRPSYTGLISGGSVNDGNDELAAGLLNKNSWIKAQDTILGGPYISSWTQTQSAGSGITHTVRYYTDSSE